MKKSMMGTYKGSNYAGAKQAQSNQTPMFSPPRQMPKKPKMKGGSGCMYEKSGCGHQSESPYAPRNPRFI